MTKPTDVLETLQKLPRICASRLPSDDSPILIKRGVMGYWPLKPTVDPDAYNQRHGVTKAQEEAMLSGSMFGWDIPAADPDSYENPTAKAFESILTLKDVE